MVEMAEKRERIVPRLIEEEMRESFLDYSMSVIVQRALPDVRDGLKPVHRRILYAMYELGLRPDRGYKKSATVVGDVLGKYHPHGDSAVYDTLVRMVQDFSLRYPLVDGQGNFGSIDGDSAAAYRYTEARLAPPAMEILDELGKGTVDFSPNFDGRLEEPVVLPGRLPNLLVNGASGIAVGMSTNVPPHNLGEVAAAVRMVVEEPGCTLDDLMEVLPGPDFPTAGFIVGTEAIREMYETGRGRMTMRGRIVRESIRGGKSQLVVTEIPYTVSKVKVIEQVTSLAKAGKLDEASDIRDESDRDGMRLVIELKRGADVARALKVLYKRTYLQYTFGGILIALDHGQPKELSLREILEAYRDHRLEVIRRRSRHDLEEAEDERHVLEGLLVALDAIDEVIALIRASEDPEEAAGKLREEFDLTGRQADAILSMRLAKLTALETEELRARMDELEGLIAELGALLDSEEEQLRLLLDELDEVVEEYGDPRRTEILEEEEDEIDLEHVAAEEDVVVTLSHEGYVKRIPMHLYRRRRSGGKQLAAMERYDEDYLERVFVVTTTDTLLVFTGTGQCHFLPVVDVPESSRSSRGQNLSTVLGIPREDRVVGMVPADDLEADRRLLFLTEGGTVKRSELSEYSNPRAGGVIAIGLKDGDRLFDVALAEETGDVVLVTRRGRAIRFPAEEVPVVGRTAQGVRGVKLEEGDAVVGVVLVRRDASVLVITARGHGKQVPVGEYPIQHRDGLGNLTVAGDGEEDELVCALELVAGDEVMLITAGGRTTRIPAAEIPTKGRRNKGRELFEVPEGDRLVEVTRVLGGPGREAGDDAEEAEEAAGAGEDEGQLELMEE